MKKIDEKALLSKLADGDTYTSKFFGEYGIEISKVLANIDNDFPIEHGSELESIDANLSGCMDTNIKLEKKVDRLERKVTIEQELVRFIMGNFFNLGTFCLQKGFEENLGSWFSQGDIVKMKLEAGLELTGEQVKNLTELIKKSDTMDWKGSEDEG